MICAQFRERLTEHALGMLPAREGREVERHIQWCASCRRESGELHDASARMALALPQAEPPKSLEKRVVDTILMAAGKRPLRSRTALRAALTGMLAAVVVAVGALSWAVAERGRVRELAETEAATSGRTRGVLQLLSGLGGKGFVANLRPPSGRAGSGRVVLISTLGLDGMLVEVALSDRQAPYSVRLLDGSGGFVVGGRLKSSDNGAFTMFDYFRQDLSEGKSLIVVNRSGRTVLEGAIRPYAGR